MASTIREIRHRKREQRLRDLRRDAATALANQPSSSLWLFGSWPEGTGTATPMWMCWPLPPAAMKPADWRMP